MKIQNTVSQVMKIWLRMFGIWPNMSCVLFCRLFWIVALIVEQILQYRYVVNHFHLIEFSEIMSILGAIVAYTVFLIKLIIFWVKQRTFNKILMMMAIDWEKCSSTKFSMFTMTCNAKRSQRFVNMTMDLPFDVNRRFVYESVIIVQFLHLILCSEAIGLLNALLINLILHVGGQIDILCQNLMEMFPKKGKSGPNNFMIKEIIEKHQKIITFSRYIEDLYSYIALVLFISDTLIICFLGFTIVTSIGRSDGMESIMKNLAFYLNMNMEAFIFCFSGEYLSAKSKSIGDAAYDSLWYKSDSRDSRTVQFLIMRSQNQLTITIGKIMNLSLDRFSSVSSFFTRDIFFSTDFILKIALLIISRNQ
ncbi:odorant receptor 67c isoform X3 [Solenopsis invicta]|uniref:odorant receptor 67c isoform X3 n=1 Tax=Solenopsis invicta TaxID=13686 RepID=UPI00193DF367|nr:odorant receptor 67c isoform X3 [Solenopsis invicta]